MKPSRISSFLSRHKTTVAITASALLFAGVAANAAGTVNGLTPNANGKDYHRYHTICVDLKTKKITYGGDANTSGCNSPSFTVVSTSGLAAATLKGLNGLNGKDGINGKNGVDGRDGKTLWNGIKDPEITWGTPGDMYINATTKTLFGPKNLDGTWPAGVSLVGPKGDQGPIGLTGATGPQGPGGSGPAGATGATGATGAVGPAGANGAAGTNGTNGTNGTSVGFVSPYVGQAITLNNADSQWTSFIEVASMSELTSGNYVFSASVNFNNSGSYSSPSTGLCFVYGGDVGTASIIGYVTGTATLTMHGVVRIPGLNGDFIKIKCGKSNGNANILVQYPLITAIKVDTITQTP